MKDVDKLIVFNYTPTDTIKHVIIETDEINLITSLVDGKVDESIKQCDPTGHILFYKGNDIVFESFFTTTHMKDQECEQLSYFLSPQRYNTKLTYRAGMFLSDLYR